MGSKHDYQLRMNAKPQNHTHQRVGILHLEAFISSLGGGTVDGPNPAPAFAQFIPAFSGVLFFPGSNRPMRPRRAQSRARAVGARNRWARRAALRSPFTVGFVAAESRSRLACIEFLQTSDRRRSARCFSRGRILGKSDPLQKGLRAWPGCSASRSPRIQKPLHSHKGPLTLGGVAPPG